ncbi:HD domain-containing protein, partial [bacterium]|nr:HD domain-containing protein [bacterium]
MLKIISFPWSIAQIVLQHHERIDGSGYPNGLLGKDILIEAQVIGISDVVEAMTYPRSYRPALGIDKALEEIEINKGRLY